MKKKYSVLTTLATGFFVAGSVGFVQADIYLTEDYYALFGTPIAGYTVMDRDDTDANEVFDVNNVLIGYTGSAFSGIYIGTVTATPGQGGGNPITEAEMEALASYFLGVPFDADIFIKVDEPSLSGTDDGVTLNISYASDKKTGTWDVDPNNYALNFYGVKGSTEWALYFVDPAQNTGIWSTQHLLNNGGNIPAISHFAGTIGEAENPIPEPATMLLFGTGLAGLAGLARRKKE